MLLPGEQKGAPRKVDEKSESSGEAEDNREEELEREFESSGGGESQASKAEGQDQQDSDQLERDEEALQLNQSLDDGQILSGRSPELKQPGLVSIPQLGRRKTVMEMKKRKLWN